MRSAKQLLFTSLSAALALSGLAALGPTPAGAAPGDPHLVISEVYGGGGNSGSVWKSDFVELYNPTAAAIPGADLRLIPGMGHDLPEPLYDTIIDAIVAAAERAR